MRRIKYGKFLLLLIFVMSIVYSGGDVGSSKVVHADETTGTTETTYEDFYNFNQLPESDIVLTDTFELIRANMENNSGVNHGPSVHPDRDDVVIITQNEQWQFGGLWYKNEIDMEKDFSMRMYVNLGDKWNNGNYDGNLGADGITFTIQGHTNTSGVALGNTIGANGAGLGAYAKDSDDTDPFNAYKSRFIRNALVLEFDTFYNNLEELTHDNGTPNFGNGGDNGAKFYGHIDLTKTPAWLGADQERFYKQHNTSEPYFRSPDNLYDATNQDLTNNRWRKVEVSWDSSTHALTYDIAGYSPIVYQFSGSEEVEETFGGTKVYWGFTGSTGDSYNLQQVGIFEVPDQTESSIEKLARNITKDGENAEFAEEAIMKLGDTIEYQVTLDYPAEVNTQDIVAAVIEDKLPAELNYVDGSLRVQLNGSDITPTPDWNNGEIHLGNFGPGNKFVVTYQAVVEEEGVIDNIATFYSKYTNPISDTAQVYSGSINILKVDGTNQPLEGAEFTVEGPNGFSENLPRDEEASSSTSTYKLDYLEPGDYIITETKAPDGYLPATEPQKVTVSKETVDLKVTFINYKEPDVFKEQRDVNETDWGAETTTLVGKTVDFRLSAIAPTDIDDYVKFALSDQIDARLDYTMGSTTVYINDLANPMEVGDHYTLTEANNGTLEVSLTKAGITKLTAGATLYVEFSAVVNESALGEGPIKNTAIVAWDNDKGDEGDKESEPTITIPEEGSITITKVAKNDNDKLLDGATFKLQRLDENGEWQDVANSSQTTGETGELTWDRLASGKYRLVETVAPAGYNLLANPIEFIIDDGVNLTHEFPVENIPKGEFPQTGGIGGLGYLSIGSLLIMMSLKFYIIKEEWGFENE